MTENKCNIRILPDDILGVKLELEGECEAALQVIDDLPDGNRKNYWTIRTQLKSSDSSSI